MNVNATTTTLQALLRQLEPAAAPAAKPKSPQIQKAEAAPQQHVTPTGNPQFDPNSPRGTYLNIVV